MKKAFVHAILSILILSSCTQENQSEQGKKQTIGKNVNDALVQNGYSEVNGIKMYYEIYGKGKPLVLIHGGGSTIQSNFGQVIQMFAEDRKVIAMELQAHGRTGDRDKDSSFEQDADDVATLLKNLNIDKADFFGFSNGGTTTIQIALRHPEIVDKIILGSALYKRNGVPAQFWDFMKQATLSNMPEELVDAYLAVSPNRKGLQIMHDRDAKRMVNFKDIPDDQIKTIKAKTLIIIGDRDIISPEHAIEMHRKIGGAELAIIPGVHGEYIGEITTLKSNSKQPDFVIPMIKRFLDPSKAKQ
ncbi:alpha/beta hydrolase [Pedobacter sp. P351]|uniref:alpha/beta fold hydrolase n=1 Tax=Pedobacter superstes TaxID=3133441 RepID=UPI0030A377F9